MQSRKCQPRPWIGRFLCVLRAMEARRGRQLGGLSRSFKSNLCKCSGHIMKFPFLFELFHSSVIIIIIKTEILKHPRHKLFSTKSIFLLIWLVVFAYVWISIHRVFWWTLTVLKCFSPIMWISWEVTTETTKEKSSACGLIEFWLYRPVRAHC